MASGMAVTERGSCSLRKNSLGLSSAVCTFTARSSSSSTAKHRIDNKKFLKQMAYDDNVVLNSKDYESICVYGVHMCAFMLLCVCVCVCVCISIHQFSFRLPLDCRIAIDRQSSITFAETHAQAAAAKCPFCARMKIVCR